MHEVEVGPASVTVTMKLVDVAKLLYALDGYIDAMSLIQALSVCAIKVPQEQSFLLSLLWLSQYVRSGLIRSRSWTDTRHMIADGLTKGNIDRRLLHNACNGFRSLTHDIKTLLLKAS